jgi:hypothetical protein
MHILKRVAVACPRLWSIFETADASRDLSTGDVSVAELVELRSGGLRARIFGGQESLAALGDDILALVVHGIELTSSDLGSVLLLDLSKRHINRRTLMQTLASLNERRSGKLVAGRCALELLEEDDGLVV